MVTTEDNKVSSFGHRMKLECPWAKTYNQLNRKGTSDEVLYLCADGGLCPRVGRLWWGTSILPLACCHIKCVASPLQQSLIIRKHGTQRRILFTAMNQINQSLLSFPVNLWESPCKIGHKMSCLNVRCIQTASWLLT